MFGLFGAGLGGNRTFEQNYRAMPVAFIDKPQAEDGDKIFLPPSALHVLAGLHVEYPMLFKVENGRSGRFTHCGVLEFIADEGCAYLPHWMMQNLLLEVGDMIRIKNVSLPKGKYVKLQPVTSDFLDISNPKAVLERSLRGYSCLTVGDCFVVNYNGRKYEIEVRETKPAGAISVIETDCEVDFEAPKDYKEPERVPPPPPAAPAAPLAGAGPSAGAAGGAAAAPAEEEEGPKFLPFAGSGRRLNGKPASSPTIPLSIPSTSKPAAGPSNGAAAAASPAAGSSAGASKAGTFVSFGNEGNRLLAKLNKDKAPAAAAAAPPPAEESKDEGPKFKAFQGTGRSLKG